MRSAYERVMARVQPEGDCVVFTGYRLPKGHGQVREAAKMSLTHRVVWEECNGPIPEGMVVRHACDNPPCVNIEHLLIGTVADNNHDRAERGRNADYNASKTHCKYGHPYDEENTRTYRGQRHCRECKRAYNKAYVRKKTT